MKRNTAMAAMMIATIAFVWHNAQQLHAQVNQPLAPRDSESRLKSGPEKANYDGQHTTAIYRAAVQPSNAGVPQYQTDGVDRLVLKNGKTLEGEVVAEDQRTVTLEIFMPPSFTITHRVSRAQIASWARPSRNGVPYVVIPIFGEIGSDVTVDALRAGLSAARAANPRYIILAIDSPGGDVCEMSGMVDLLIDASRDAKIVAYVKQAYSAAAVIAMCCHEVYMRPDAVLGAAVPFRMTENGPADVDAKFRSAFQAKVRASTAQGGHADLLIRGMSESDLNIFIAKENGKTVLRTFGPGKLIKSSGQILTLTADEAVECGLAHIAKGTTDLGEQVAGGAWYESTHRPWNAVVGTVASQRQRERDRLDQQRRILARQAAIERVKPEYDAIEHHIAALIAKGVASRDAIEGLTAQCNSELQQIENEYRQALALTQYQADPDAAAARALEVRNARAAATRQTWQGNVAALQSPGEAALLEVAQLRAREKALIATVPPG